MPDTFHHLPKTGHHEIDTQHADLDHMLAEALAFCPQGKESCINCSTEQQATCRRQVKALTRELLKFMAGHFRYEDQLMRTLPDNMTCREHIRRHQRAHGDISGWVSALTAKLPTHSPYAVAAELQRILTEWTGSHAAAHDSGMIRLTRQMKRRELDDDTELAVLLAQQRR